MLFGYVMTLRLNYYLWTQGLMLMHRPAHTQLLDLTSRFSACSLIMLVCAASVHRVVTLIDTLGKLGRVLWSLWLVVNFYKVHH